MYGRSASQLLKEQASCESGQLAVFNVSRFLPLLHVAPGWLYTVFCIVFVMVADVLEIHVLVRHFCSFRKMVLLVIWQIDFV
ncbi:hypothetical protein GW17_00037835 [Ensete ventricosum]|nr:hypothetical protein GW17_00037835 [Ensete ventricosum]